MTQVILNTARLHTRTIISTYSSMRVSDSNILGGFSLSVKKAVVSPVVQFLLNDANSSSPFISSSATFIQHASNNKQQVGGSPLCVYALITTV